MSISHISTTYLCGIHTFHIECHMSHIESLSHISVPPISHTHSHISVSHISPTYHTHSTTYHTHTLSHISVDTHIPHRVSHISHRESISHISPTYHTHSTTVSHTLYPIAHTLTHISLTYQYHISRISVALTNNKQGKQ